MALTRDLQVKRQEGQLAAYPVYELVIIYKGSLVCVNTNGYAVPAADSASFYFVGVAAEYVDNSAGASGDKWVTVYRTGLFELPATSIAQAHVGDIMYVVDDGTFDETTPANSIICGRLQRYISATRGVLDISYGTAIGTSMAGTGISIADSGGYYTATNAETVLQEVGAELAIYNVGCVSVPLTSLRETTNFNVGNIAANGGVLASDTSPILSAINGATDGCQMLTWAANNNDQVIFQTALSPDLDDTADVVVHFRTKSEGVTDAVGFTVDSFFNEGDTKVVDTSTTNQTASWAEKIATIGNADVPSGAQTLTVGLTPVAHTTDKMYLSAVWIEYTKKVS